MIKILKSNKNFTCCFLLTIFFLLAGLFFNSLIDISVKKEITQNINTLISNFSKDSYSLALIIKTLFNNSLNVLFLWALGISIIGIPIIVVFYSLRTFLLGFEFISLLSNLKLANILFVVLYLLPSFLNLGIFFILLYYSINYSLVLIKILFMKKTYNLREITRRYLKVLLFTFLCGLLTALLESFVVPKVLTLIL